MSERNSQQDAGDDIGNHRDTVGAVESDEVVGDSGQDPFSHSNDTQRRPKILFGIALIIEQQRKGGAGDSCHGVQRSDSHSEGDRNSFFGLDGFSDTGSLEQNQWQQHEVRDKLDPCRMNERKNITADSHADQKTDQNGRHPPPDVSDAVAIDEEHISIDHQFHKHQCRIQNPIGIKKQCNGNGNRRKAVPQSAIDGRGYKRDEYEDDEIHGYSLRCPEAKSSSV